jgi:Family of unknown function (DUF6176)
MLRVVIRSVKPGRTEVLRQWLQEVGGPRREEALATLVEEGCTHEQAVLIEGKDGPVIVYVMEVEDVEASQQAARTSPHAIDADHRRVMEEAVGDPVPSEVLLDLQPIMPS